jgi:ubiquinone/menaquinone biosynthesis C-methylase UbiE
MSADPAVEPDWLADVRTSYDTVATDYADLLRDALDRQPHDRAVLRLFADLVRDSGAGPVADVGCGPGRITAHLAGLGVEASGLDLSPGMVAVACRDHPDLPFVVGSMTDLPYAAGSLGGLLAWYSLIHLADDLIPGVLAGFRRVLRPGGVLLLAFQVGDERRLKTSGYGGHPMHLYVHLRPTDRVAAALRDAGFDVNASLIREKEGVETTPQAYLIARRPQA